MMEIEIRSTPAEVADVNVKQRIITVIAVPYEQPAQIHYRGEMWDEVFSRTAFSGIEKRPARFDRGVCSVTKSSATDPGQPRAPPRRHGRQGRGLLPRAGRGPGG